MRLWRSCVERSLFLYAGGRTALNRPWRGLTEVWMEDGDVLVERSGRPTVFLGSCLRVKCVGLPLQMAELTPRWASARASRRGRFTGEVALLAEAAGAATSARIGAEAICCSLHLGRSSFWKPDGGLPGVAHGGSGKMALRCSPSMQQ